jgi:glycogen synthase
MARVTMFVLNDCRTDARVLREAATLATAGHLVTIVARTVDPYAPRAEREEHDGFTIVRAPVGSGLTRWLLLGRRPPRFARELVASARRLAGDGMRGWATLGLLSLLLAVASPAILVLGLIAGLCLGVLRHLPAAEPVWRAVEWRLQWRFGVAPWTREAVRAAPAGDIFHAHDMRALPAAIAARARAGGLVVYDSHEIFVEADANARRSATSRAALRRLERRLASQATALVTVNDDLGSLLGDALGFRGRTVVVRNCRPRWSPPEPEPDLLRRAAGVPAGVPLVLSHGLFSFDRGFAEIAAALALPALADVHAVFLGLGPFRSRLDELAAGPPLAGRLHVLEAVPPDELLGWIRGADVNVVAIQPTTLNHRLSTPNKLFESLAAGVPVVASDFPPMRRIVMDDPDGPLGLVCDPTDPVAIAVAIRSLVDLPREDAAALRARCLGAAHARYAWEVDGARLVELYARLAEDLASGRAA